MQVQGGVREHAGTERSSSVQRGRGCDRAGKVLTQSRAAGQGASVAEHCRLVPSSQTRQDRLQCPSNRMLEMWARRPSVIEN